MYEQIRLAPNDIRQPMMCPSLVASQGLELPMGPSCQDLVDVAQGGIEGRLVVTAVVVDPAADVTIEHPSKIIQRLVAALMERPVADSLPDRLEMADLFIIGVAPYFSSELLGFRIAPDTLSSTGLRRWLARHYPCLWIQRPSFERWRDFNPPVYALPYRRFAVALADDRARLRADADRYSFMVSDLHHYRTGRNYLAPPCRRCRNAVLGAADYNSHLPLKWLELLLSRLLTAQK